MNKTLQESFNRFLFFCLTKQKGSVELILLALQSNSTGSVLINDGTLGAGIKELKPDAAAPILLMSKDAERNFASHRINRL